MEFRKNVSAIGFLSILALGAPASAATTGTITLQGVIPASTAIAVSGISGYDNLTLTTAASDLHVANVREINNTTNGYTVTLSSQNSGSLKNGTLGSVSYTASYDGTNISLSSTPVTVTTGAPSTTVVNSLKAFKISYSAQDPTALMMGSYSDTLTFAITAN